MRAIPASPKESDDAAGQPVPAGAGEGRVSPPPTAMTFWLNLAILSVTGVMGSIWLLRFTDLLEAFGGLLGAGGALVWLAVLWGLLPEARSAKIREFVSHHLFEVRATSGIASVLLVLGILCARGVGGYQVEAAPDLPPTRVWIYPEGGSREGVEPVHLAPGDTWRSCVWLGWRAPSSLVIDTFGFPPKTIPIRAFERTDVTLPYSAIRPVVLVRGPSHLVAAASRGAHRLVVKVGAAGPVTIPFLGRPVWVGTPSLEIPRYVLDGWAEDRDDDLRWAELLKPVSDRALAADVDPGTEIEAWLENSVDGSRYLKSARHRIQPADSLETMVQVLWIRGEDTHD